MSANSASTSRAGEGRPWRILVVDDDELSASVQTQLLRLLGYESSAETDGHRAAERALGEGFDLLLVDLSMPALDGYSFLRRLREREAQARRPPLPLIAVTGYTAPEDRDRTLAAGFVQHVTKPVQLPRLQAAVEAALGAPAPLGAELISARTITDLERLRATVQRLSQVAPPSDGFAPTAIEAFALRSAQLIDSLRETIDHGDAERAVRYAQTLDTNAGFLGASALSANAAAIAECCAAGDWPRARKTLQEFELQHQAVLTVLFQLGG